MPNSEIATPAMAMPKPSPAFASDVVSRWLRIDATLSPIIGRGGVVALYHRSLHVMGRNYPWISLLGDGENFTIHLTVLERDLEKQPDHVAARAAAEFLATFHDLVAGLIGPSLSTRLLSGSVSTDKTRPRPRT